MTVSREWGGNGNLEIEGALVTHPINNNQARTILTGKADGTAVVASAGGDAELRVEFIINTRVKFMQQSFSVVL